MAVAKTIKRYRLPAGERPAGSGSIRPLGPMRFLRQCEEGATMKFAEQSRTKFLSGRPP
jgi:hypothetical protein